MWLDFPLSIYLVAKLWRIYLNSAVGPAAESTSAVPNDYLLKITRIMISCDNNLICRKVKTIDGGVGVMGQGYC